MTEYQHWLDESSRLAILASQYESNPNLWQQFTAQALQSAINASETAGDVYELNSAYGAMVQHYTSLGEYDQAKQYVIAMQRNISDDIQAHFMLVSTECARYRSIIELGQHPSQSYEHKGINIPLRINRFTAAGDLDQSTKMLLDSLDQQMRRVERSGYLYLAIAEQLVSFVAQFLEHAEKMQTLKRLYTVIAHANWSSYEFDQDGLARVQTLTTTAHGMLRIKNF